MSVIGRLSKSVHYRMRESSMLARGIVTKALMPGLLQGGQDLKLGRNVAMVILGELVLGKGVIVSDGAALEVGPHGRLVLGDGVFVGRHSVIAVQQFVELGARTAIGEHCTVRDQDHHVDPEERLREHEAVTAPLIVGANVWIGAGARLLRGSSIGGGSIVAANAVVRTSVASGVIVGGVPARVLGPVHRTTPQPESPAS